MFITTKNLIITTVLVVAAYSVLSTTLAVAAQIAIPQIKVSEVKLENENLVAGTDVKGSFFLANTSTFLADNLYYRISLVERYRSGGIAEAYLDQSVASDTFSLNPKEAKGIEFNYRVPSYVGGEGFGVQVGVYNKLGMLLGWTDLKGLSITPDKFGVEIISSEVSLLGKGVFNINESLAINPEDAPKGELLLSVRNPGDESVTVAPIVTISSLSDRTTVLQTINSEDKTLTPGSSVDWSVELPNFDYESGVYFAEVLLVDSNGEKRSKPLGFRYSVEGKETAIVYEFSTDKQSLGKGEVFNTTVAYSVSKGINASAGPVMVNVEVYNEHDKLVDSYNEEVVLAGTLSRIMRASYGAKALRGVVTISRGENVLVSESKTFSVDYDEVRSNASKYWPGVILVSVLSILVLAGVSLLRSRNKIGRKTFLALVAIVVVIAMFSLSRVQSAYAFVQTGYDAWECLEGDDAQNYNGNVQTTQYVSAVIPYDDTRFQTGAAFDVTGSLYYPYGAPYQIDVYAAPTSGSAASVALTPPYTPSSLSPQFSVGSIIIGPEHGTQSINLTISGHYNVYCKNDDPEDCGAFSSNPAPSQFDFVRACKVYTYGYISYINDEDQYECIPGYEINENDECVPAPTDGECGCSSGESYESIPSSDLCIRGVATLPLWRTPASPGDPNVFWYCYDPNFLGEIAECSATVSISTGECTP